MYNFSCVSNGSMDYITYDVHDINVKSRFVMDISGQFKQFRWLERTKKWKRIWSQPRNQCDVYSYCGPFGSCNEKSAPVCSCLQGFEPDSIKNWNSLGFSGGCKRRNALQCVNNTTSKGAGDRFIPLSKVAPPSNPIALDVQSIDDCKSYCLNNCACSAYSYIQHGCSIWIGDLINLRVLSLDYISGKDIYLKLAAAEFSTGREDLLSFDFSICTSPTNYEQTESNSLNLLGHVWDLWTNSRPLELMDPILQDSSSANSLIRYVNIALLCVQERAVDRPTMSDVVLMLSNELTFLSTPKQPAFSSVRSMVDNNSPITKPEICSVNEVTVSMMQAR
ncbi:hypothetical protein QUC31_001968 [Theobroma cacao]